MAAQQSFKDVNPDYLKTVIVQRCEFDEAAMGSAIPMDAGAVDAAVEDAGSLGQRGVGPGLGKGGPPRALLVRPVGAYPQVAHLAGTSTTGPRTTGSHPAPAVDVGLKITSETTAQPTPIKASTPPAKEKAKTARARDVGKANGARAKESEE